MNRGYVFNTGKRQNRYGNGQEDMMPPPSFPSDMMYDERQLVDPNDRNKYEYVDNIEQYGSIIKDLTDTEKILEDYELRLRGKVRKKDGSVHKDPNLNPYIKTDQAARDFVDFIRSVVNRHNDFSFYDEKEADKILMGANYEINRWLMLHGDVVPLRYRSKISFEAMAHINSSTHKAINGRMLTWTKGSFSEGRSMHEGGSPHNKKSILNYIFPFMKKN